MLPNIPVVSTSKIDGLLLILHAYLPGETGWDSLTTLVPDRNPIPMADTEESLGSLWDVYCGV